MNEDTFITIISDLTTEKRLYSKKIEVVKKMISNEKNFNNLTTVEKIRILQEINLVIYVNTNDGVVSKVIFY